MRSATNKTVTVTDGGVNQRISTPLLLLLLCLLLGGALRLYEIRDAGAIYHDDLRAYSGQAIVDALSAPGIAFSKRVADAQRVSIEHTGARPALAWLTAIPSALGFRRIGDLFIPFALISIATIPLIWLLGKRWFDTMTAFFAALWFATSAAAVGYARSALPVSASTALMILGLYVFLRSPDARLEWHRIAATGTCFALAFAFHPAYLAYLGVPLFLILWQAVRAPARQAIPTVLAQCCVLVAPTILFVIAYDAPRMIANLAGGQFAMEDMVYLSGLRDLIGNPAISGTHEGVLFWPEYLLSAEGALGLAVISIAAVSYLSLSRTAFTLVCVAWLLLPWIAFVVWPNLNSYGRLYAPLLPVVALIVGRGASCAIACLSASRLRMALSLLFGVSIITSGVDASTRFLQSEGKEPALARYMEASNITSAIGFIRTDARALSAIRIASVYTPADIKRALCEDGITHIVLSPASFYLVIRHSDYLFSGLALEPVYTYPNPYRMPARLMEGQGPSERELVLGNERFSRLGLFRIANFIGCLPQ